MSNNLKDAVIDLEKLLKTQHENVKNDNTNSKKSNVESIITTLNEGVNLKGVETSTKKKKRILTGKETFTKDED